MKKVLFTSVLALTLFSCYDDYVKDYEYDAIYFPREYNVRTVVGGEKMSIEVGTALGGTMDNDRDRLVNFIMDNKLVTAEVLDKMTKGDPHIKSGVSGVTELLPMPDDFYSLSSESMVIKKGMHTGVVRVDIDSTKFIRSGKYLKANYVLPFFITSADTDSILEKNRSTVIGIMYENKLFGNYYYGGVKVTKNSAGEIIDEKKYYTTIPSPEGSLNVLTTISHNSLQTSKLAGDVGNLIFELQQDGKIRIQNNNNISEDGESSFNNAKLLQNRKIFLSYKIDNQDGTTTFVKDTLTFRNRIRDGVNEWQDENPENYE